MTVDTLFSNIKAEQRPLADLMRPEALTDIYGQISRSSWISQMWETGRISNLLIHGPPGVGKTTLARCLLHRLSSPWKELSALTATLKDLRPVLQSGRNQFQSTGRAQGLFIDEIHRFSTVQQDALLPYLEEGSTILIGATTENPSFSMNRALRSRMRILKLEALSKSELVSILKRAWDSPKISEFKGQRSNETVDFDWIAAAAQGDARRALSILEAAIRSNFPLSVDGLESLELGTILDFDRKGDAHYQYISAFIKSMRNGEERDAAYWLLRMVDAGGDVAFIFRRMAIFASEDVGNADPQALQIVDSASRLFDRVGRPEGDHLLMQVALYLSRAPKSREVVAALSETRALLKEEPNRKVPKHLQP